MTKRAIVPLVLLVGPLVGGCAATEDSPDRDSEAFRADRSGYVEVDDGVRLHYRLLGSPGDTLVVLHGGPGAGINSILPAVMPLARDRVLLLYDQRGGGLSTLPEDTTELSAEAFVRDLEAVRRHFGIERMQVFTHSFGSVLLARYAQRHPNRLKRIVLHGATGPSRREAVELIRRSAGSKTGRGDTALARRNRELMLRLLRGEAEDPLATCRAFEETGRELARSRGEDARWPGTTCDASARAVRYYYRYTAQLAPRSFGDWDFAGTLSGVRAPALVIWGARDTAAVPLQRQWARAYPEGRLLLVPGSGKGAIADRPALVREAVDTFLRGEWPDGATAPDTVSGVPASDCQRCPGIPGDPTVASVLDGSLRPHDPFEHAPGDLARELVSPIELLVRHVVAVRAEGRHDVTAGLVDGQDVVPGAVVHVDGGATDAGGFPDEAGTSRTAPTESARGNAVSQSLALPLPPWSRTRSGAGSSDSRPSGR